MKKVTIVDYGMGNIRSLVRALERVGADAEITSDPQRIARAERLVVPGQGAFGQAMQRLKELGLKDPLTSALDKGRPYLGICLGLQILFERSEEAPGIEGLGAIAGSVRLLPVSPDVRRPHMGWAPVDHGDDAGAIAANPSGEPYYFVHSYAALEAAPSFVQATATSGVKFVAAVEQGPLLATQFHPEKSQQAGSRILSAWLTS